MADEPTTTTLPTFGTIARADLPKRPGPKHERTAEEVALRDSLWAIILDGATGAVDPTTYVERKAAVNAANRYRLLLTPLVADEQRIETRLIAKDGVISVTILLGKRPAAKATAARKATR